MEYLWAKEFGFDFNNTFDSFFDPQCAVLVVNSTLAQELIRIGRNSWIGKKIIIHRETCQTKTFQCFLTFRFVINLTKIGQLQCTSNFRYRVKQYEAIQKYFIYGIV